MHIFRLEICTNFTSLRNVGNSLNKNLTIYQYKRNKSLAYVKLKKENTINLCFCDDARCLGNGEIR